MNDFPATDLQIRRRRALWRAQHRGTKELDHLLGLYAERKIFKMKTIELDRFEGFLSLSERELQNYLLNPNLHADLEYSDIVNDIRSFHGLR